MTTTAIYYQVILVLLPIEIVLYTMGLVNTNIEKKIFDRYINNGISKIWVTVLPSIIIAYPFLREKPTAILSVASVVLISTVILINTSMFSLKKIRSYHIEGSDYVKFYMDIDFINYTLKLLGILAIVLAII